MKAILKSAFFHNGKVLKKGDTIEIETTAFKPWLMSEVPEAKVKKVAVEERTSEETELPVEEKTTKRRRRKAD